MPPPGAIRAGRAFVELFADDSKLVRGLRRASARLKAFGASVSALGKRMMVLGAAVTAGLAGTAKVFSSVGDRVDKMAARIGASTEFVSALGHAARIGGTDLSAMEVGMRRLQRTAVDYTRNLSTAVEAFDMLGVAVMDANGKLKPTEQLFLESAAALSKMENNTMKAGVASMLFGRSGTMLLPMLREGSKGLLDMMEEGERLGIVLSREDAEAAAEFTDQMQRLKSVVQMAMFRIGQAAAPVLEEMAMRMLRVVRAATAWIKEHRGVVVSALKIAAALTVAGVATLSLGFAIKGLGIAFLLLAKALPLVKAGLLLVVKMIGLLFTPLGALVALVATVGAALVYMTGTVGKLLAWLGERFGGLLTDAKDAFGGIRDALAGGDIRLAARIFWLFLKLAWQHGAVALREVWLGFKTKILKSHADLCLGMSSMMGITWNAVKTTWRNSAAALKMIWQEFSGWFQKKTQKTIGAVAKGILWLRSQFDEDFDYQAAVRMSDQMTQAAVDRMEAEKAAAMRAIGEKWKAESDAADRAHAKNLTNIVDEHTERMKAIEAERVAGVEGTEDEIKKAREELRKSISDAKAKRKEAELPDVTEPDEWLRKLREMMAGIGEVGAKQAKAAVETRGTFNRAAMQSLVAGGVRSVQERAANAAEEIADNTKEIKQDIKENVLVFEP